MNMHARLKLLKPKLLSNMVIFEMVMGLPLSGKTYYARQRQLDDWVRISFEDVEVELNKTFGSVEAKEVKFEMVQRAKEALLQGHNVVFDSWNLTKEERIEIFNKIKDTVKQKTYYYLVYVNTDFDIITKRNNLKRKYIQELLGEVTQKQLEPPSYGEGWDLIKTISC